MLEYLHFFFCNKRLLSFGFLLTFFSSFGQTFLLSLYVPGIIRDFALTNSSFGLLYGTATILSSFALFHIGKFIDSRSLRNYSLFAVALLLISCLAIAFSFNILILFLGIWGLRFAGQGLLSHISNTSISRCFDSSRGKALSLSVLGYSFGEGFFPIIIGTLIAFIGWRYSMVFSAAFILIVLLPFIAVALNKEEYRKPPVIANENKERVTFRRTDLLKDFSFYILTINTVVLPALITGLFFYQMLLAQEKGWPAGWLPSCFIAYAAGRSIFSLLSGNLIDRFSAIKILPFYLLPFFAGLLTLIWSSHLLAAPLYLALSGVSMGMSSTIKSAIIAETYGTAHIGSIRSFLATCMVIGTAVSPVLFGLALDSGLGFVPILWAAASLTLFTAAATYLAGLSSASEDKRSAEAFSTV